MARPPWNLATPVALFIFNRPETTRRVFETIRAVRPQYLLVVADGSRAGREGEEERCCAARSVIDSVDWDCRVLTNYAKKNMGCRRRVSSGLDWVFSEVEEAIILEDDCLPHPTFFKFCQELLERFRLDTRIAQISGVNLQFGRLKQAESYYFSRYNHVWGWATWKRAWCFNDNDLSEWPSFRDKNLLKNRLSSKREEIYWKQVLDKVYNDEIDSWAYRWSFSCLKNELLSVTPSINLVSNIGFGSESTHTPVRNKYSEMRTEAMLFPMIHHDMIVANSCADDFIGKTVYREYSFWARLLAVLRGEIPLKLPKFRSKP